MTATDLTTSKRERFALVSRGSALEAVEVPIKEFEFLLPIRP